MDPTQIQSDKDNDAHSLEQVDGAEDGQGNTTDATGGEKTTAAPPPLKRSVLKKLWDKFNIYLLLFVLIVLGAIAILVTLTAKSKQATQTTLTTQGLSQDALKQLASTDVTVGNPKQVLTVQANAIFAGAVLIRSNLEVAGTLKIGGSLSLADLTVSGISKLGDLEVNNLTVNSSMNLQGTLTVRNGLNISGRSSFSGEIVASSISTNSLNLTGDLNLTHHITAGGTIPAIDKGAAVGGGGTVSLSGSDTAGSIVINTGNAPPAGCFATVTFSQKFSNTPHVVVSPVGAGAASLDFYVTRSTSSFVLCATNAATASQTFGFDYVVLN
jgi:hypothetical protein